MLTEAVVADAMRQAQEAERLSPEALAQLQERRLRHLLRHAVAGSPFYARLYQGIDAERARLTELPTISKEQVQQNFGDVVTDRRLRLEEVQHFGRSALPQGFPLYQGGYVVLQSSGTSGLRGWYVWDRAALAAALATGRRQSQRSETPTKRPRIAALLQVDPTDATFILLSLVPASVGEVRLLDIRQTLPALIVALNAFQPTHLAAYPYLLWLLGEAVREGRLQIRPERITSSADVLSASDRAALRATFGVEPFDYYCSTEVPYLAWECGAHEGLHVNADQVLLEAVDRANRPVPPGTLSDKILITNLANHTMPLIRYEMSDQVEFMTAPCPCGCRLPRIRTVAGRIENVLTLPGVGGRPVPLIEEYVDDFVGRVAGVARYQVIQEAAAQLTVNLVVRVGIPWEDARFAVLDGLDQCFRKYGVASRQLHLELHRREQLEPIEPGSRKVCRFWNRAR
jgi:phenylacetate-coenzyme A ligase PaaK-like adenylate-forming protein